MGESNRLRLGDVRRTFRLLGECRDLGHDPEAWRPHAFEGLAKMLGARGATGGEVAWARPDGPVRFLHPVVTGFSAAELAAFARFMRERDPRDPALDPTLHALGRLGGGLVTRTRRQLVDDVRWRACVSLNEHRRPAGAEECVYTLYELQTGGTFSLIGLHRAPGERAFSAREGRLLHLFHEELGRLLGPVLISAGDPYSPARLPPRVQETLRCLLEGDSEKEAAARMRLSSETVHQYVKALYRHFRVASRAELLARVLRRTGPGG